MSEVQVVCPCCNTAITVFQEELIVRLCCWCRRQFAVPKNPEDDEYAWLCEECEQERSNQEAELRTSYGGKG